MSTTIDANVLLYAADESSPHHAVNRQLLADLATGPDLLYVFWPTAVAFLRISTHPSIFERPLAPKDAQANLADLLDRPHVRTPGEQDGFWSVLSRALASDGPVRGNLVNDAHLVALMRQHGVTRIWTTDRDFRRFDGITPLVPDAST